MRTKPGISKESIDINALVLNAVKSSRQPVSFLWRESLTCKVREIYERCSKAGWDGYDAEPIALESCLGALHVIDLLPDKILPPDAVPEPAGEISLEWRTEDELLFSLTVTGRTLVYAGIFGGHSKQHGEEHFFDQLPKTVLEILTRYFFKG